MCQNRQNRAKTDQVISWNVPRSQSFKLQLKPPVILKRHMTHAYGLFTPRRMLPQTIGGVTEPYQAKNAAIKTGSKYMETPLNSKMMKL